MSRAALPAGLRAVQQLAACGIQVQKLKRLGETRVQNHKIAAIRGLSKAGLRVLCSLSKHRHAQNGEEDKE